MYRYIIPVILLLPITAHAQGKKVKCVVTDEAGKPIKGAMAIPNATDDTLVSGANGAFTISAAEPMRVTIYANGYLDEEILVAPDAKCTVQLRRDEEADDTDSEE